MNVKDDVCEAFTALNASTFDRTSELDSTRQKIGVREKVFVRFDFGNDDS